MYRLVCELGSKPTEREGMRGRIHCVVCVVGVNDI